MTIEIKINGQYDDKLIFLYLKHHICKQGISDVVIVNDKLLIKNKFFKIQTSINPFAYMTEGYFYIKHFKTCKILYYTYSNSRFAMYFCSTLFVLSFFWKIFRLFTLLFLFVFFLNKTIYHAKQKRFIRKVILKFIIDNQPAPQSPASRNLPKKP